MTDTTTSPPPPPRVGVGILVLRGGRILLGRRRGAHGAGTWSAPGGRLEYGESIEDCARRELLEETGLALGAGERGPCTSDVFDEVRQHYVTVFVLARHTHGEPATLEPDKCDGWQWFDWSALPQPLFAPLASLRATGFDPEAGTGPHGISADSPRSA
ncbi:NUDIX hydrolase [Rhizobacter sp. SG703]|uniref:nucleotide triphosphate diphosphatase NUDT15 n=1 Tax=Rhizobacter sp. SG703 TaxID=2587140 RepID=UPI001445A4E6|nr:NUDIX hydrolase [Rhizobacter sp. SG703]NKI94138.1 8-oxo-dGTP diphosphatase [Rhizobacter sp. SG703]